MAYRPIEACGVIGDLHSIALVSTDGTIDWCCLPSFDSPSIFAAILDEKKGGHFRIAPEEMGGNRQMYLPGTNILLTRFLRDDGVAEIIDFMPVRNDSRVESEDVVHEIVRMARSIRGVMRFCLECAPAFDYARGNHQATLMDEGVIFTCGEERAVLIGKVDWKIEEGKATCVFTLQPGETAEFAFRYLTKDEKFQKNSPVDGQRLLEETTNFWHKWLKSCTYKGRCVSKLNDQHWFLSC